MEKDCRAKNVELDDQDTGDVEDTDDGGAMIKLEDEKRRKRSTQLTSPTSSRK